VGVKRKTDSSSDEKPHYKYFDFLSDVDLAVGDDRAVAVIMSAISDFIREKND